MKAVSVWSNGYKSALSNDRGHSVVVDLPTEQNGTNTGATALELCVMSLAGCITTIFKTVADKRKFNYKGFRVELEADKPGWLNVTYVWSSNSVYHINIVTSRGTKVVDYYMSPS